jgi:hypothetical protein
MAIAPHGRMRRFLEELVAQDGYVATRVDGDLALPAFNRRHEDVDLRGAAGRLGDFDGEAAAAASREYEGHIS